MAIQAKRRAIYFYICAGCGKKRYSRIYARALEKTCQKCVPAKKVDDRQISMFN